MIARSLAALVRFLIWLCPLLSYDYRHRRVKRRQVCPACGNHVRVIIRFDVGTRQVVAQCPLDLAMWAYNPVVKPEIWAKLPKMEE